MGLMNVATPPQPTARNAGLQSLRAITTLAVVMLHAAMAYMVFPLPGLVWATHDDPSYAADAFAWLANAFVMPVFFLLGGYGVSQLAKRYSPSALAKNRLCRLGLPFLFGCVVILPLDLYSWLLGFAADGRIPLRKLQSLKLDPTVSEGLFGPAHLWFLQYLLLFSCLYAGVYWLKERRSKDGTTKQALALIENRLFSTTLGVTVIGCCGAFPLFVDPQILLGFRHEIVPQLAHVLFFAPMFVFGAVWDRIVRSNERPMPFGRNHLVLGLLIWICSTTVRQAFLGHESPEWSLRAAAVLTYSVAGWFIAVGLFGMALRSHRPIHPLLGYVANGSFWIYLFHHPVVGLVHTSLKTFDVNPTVKFALTGCLAMALSLTTFEVAVRRTWIGRLLGVKQVADSQPNTALAPSSVAINARMNQTVSATRDAA